MTRLACIALAFGSIITGLSAPVFAEPGVAVVVTPVATDGTVAALIIVETVTRTERGPFRLSAPLALAGTAVASVVTDLSASDGDGALALVAIDNVAADGEQVRHWSATRAAGREVVVRYRVPTVPIGRGGPPYGFKAAGHGVAGSSSAMLLLPDDAAMGTNSLVWDVTHLPSDTSAAITGGGASVTVAGPASALADRWMLVGPLAKRSADGFTAYSLGAPPFDASGMLAWSGRAYTILANAFGYLGTPRYELMIRTLDGPAFATGTARLAGGGALVSVGTSFVHGQDEAAVRNLIFHEMGHQWVGQFSDGGALWFAEGLNVYIASTLPCSSGLQPAAACAAAINDWAKAVYLSEARNWSQSRIEAAPFAREDIRRVSYGRGMLYFAELDASLRERSQGRRSVLDLVRPLLAARLTGGRLDQPAFEAALRRELGAAAVIRFRRVVIDGTSESAPRSDAFGPCLHRIPARWTVGGVTRRGFTWAPTAPVPPGCL
jgi:hypothetical protein